VANSTGQANNVVSIDFANKTVTYKETNGFQGGKALRYVSTDASDPTAATLEHDNYAAELNNAPPSTTAPPRPEPPWPPSPTVRPASTTPTGRD
jgi:hypothetical protein